MFDVIVIGSGPAGSIAAMYLGRALGKEKVLIVDKAVFPRDKICGDAQGRRAAAVFRELGIYEEYTQLPGQKVYGITLSSPNGTTLHMDVASRSEPAPGFVHKRAILDNFLAKNAAARATFRQFSVTDILMEDGYVKGVIGANEKGEREEIRANLVLAADGANSIIAQKLGLNKNPQEHFIVGTRQYYKGVTGMSDRIEIHLVKNLIPGYFWIFPLPDGEANVGLGMVVRDMQAKKINLREATLREIRENPLFKDRFKNATAMEDVKGWNLPVASYRRKSYGNGFMLLGDAASLIDPLSGEGVGNAAVSAKLAAETAIESIKSRDCSESSLKRYYDRLWETIGPEIQANYRLQVLAKKFPFMIDRLIVKAGKDEDFHKKVEGILPYTGRRKEIATDDFLSNIADRKEVEEMLSSE